MFRRALLACVVAAPALFALPASADGCSLARSVRGRNPSYADVARELDRAAARRKVPPPLLKAIAWRESGWAQFWSDGRAKVSFDCGIGIMQITGGTWDYRRLAADYIYNIDAGALVLAAKMTASSRNVPSALGPDERRVGENWYRAVYRYNGAGWRAERYADSVFALSASPPSGIRPWTPPVAYANPKSVVPGYRPTNGSSYVARPDGTWVSSFGRFRRSIVRADWHAVQGRTVPRGTLEGDQRTGAAFFAKNVGWETWTAERISVGTWPVNRASRLRDSTWASPSRAAKLRVSVPTGGVARWDMVLKAAPVGATWTGWEGFAPVVDGWLGLGHGRSGGEWTLNPPVAPTVSLDSAPRYVTDSATDSSAQLQLRFADPAPGAGVAYVEVADRAPDGTARVVARVTSTTPRVALAGPGRHQLLVRAVDRAGHASPWTEPVPVVVPKDDSHPELTFTGNWAAEPMAESWLGTVRAAPEGASVETRFTGTSFALIGTRGPDLAPLSVYVDDVLLGVVEPFADSVVQRQVLYEGTVPDGEHVLRVVVGVPSTGSAPETPTTTAEDPKLGYLDAIAVA